MLHYGDFLAFWSTFDVLIEVIIMRELAIDAEKASIVCAGLGLGAKMAIAKSLLNERPQGTPTIKLLKEAQTLAERNSFAHGFFLIEQGTATFELIRREVEDTYTARVRKMDCDAMAKHAAQFTAKVNELQKCASVSNADLADYTKHVEARALALASQDKPRPGLQTSSGKANRKSRRSRAQPSDR